MSASRDRILGRIRRSLEREGPLSPAISGALASRLQDTARHVQPSVDDDLVARFSACLEAAGATVGRVKSAAGVARAIADYLKRHQLPARLVASGEPCVAAIKWPRTLSVETRAARDDDTASVTGALAGVAETGTLVLASGALSPTTLNFLPDDHIVVLPARRLVRHLEDAWGLVRAEARPMPRTVNLISGPSKTADVEQTLQLGAHGPRRLHVILIGKPPD